MDTYDNFVFILKDKFTSNKSDETSSIANQTFYGFV